MSVTVGLLGVGTAVAARHRAQAAADLAALAAAGVVQSGPQAACAQARVIAQAMHSTVADCAVDGLDIIVTADVAAQLGNWSLGAARAQARAGPVDASRYRPP